MLINISFGFLGLYILFIAGIYAAKVDWLCAIVGGFLHYFMLVAFLLMAAEAIHLYLKLVVVLGIPPILKNRYILKSSLIAWSKLLSATRLPKLLLFFPSIQLSLSLLL